MRGEGPRRFLVSGDRPADGALSSSASPPRTRRRLFERKRDTSASSLSPLPADSTATINPLRRPHSVAAPSHVFAYRSYVTRSGFLARATGQPLVQYLPRVCWLTLLFYLLHFWGWESRQGKSVVGMLAGETIHHMGSNFFFFS